MKSKMTEESNKSSSKLSFGSSLSADEQLEGDGPLTPTDNIQDEEDDDLSALNSLLQTGSTGSLSEEEEDIEHDSASSLSSVPDDFPLSPEPQQDIEEEEEDNSRKRKKETAKKTEEEYSRPNKKAKPTQDTNHHRRQSNSSTSSTENNKKRRTSRAALDLSEVKGRRRLSRQENIEQDIKQESDNQTNEPEPNNSNKEEEVNEHDDNDQDYQQRHKEALDALTHIEVEFARLREKMYQERMTELNEEAVMIANGTHPELVTLMAEIEEKKTKRISSAEAWRKHQHENFKQQYEGFEYQANIHFISQRNALRRTLLDSLNTKKWDIEDERLKLNDKGLFPDSVELATHKKEQREETNELQDIKEMIGFPMAPNPSGLGLQDIDDDLKLLGIK